MNDCPWANPQPGISLIDHGFWIEIRRRLTQKNVTKRKLDNFGSLSDYQAKCH